jgi:hypothetical protein
MKADAIVIAPKAVTVIAIHIDPNFFKIRLAGMSEIEYCTGCEFFLRCVDRSN